VRLNAELSHRINYELKLLERAKREYSKRLDDLRDYKGSVLRRTIPGNGKHYYYSVKQKGSKTYRYVGPSDHRIVRQVREARFLKEALRRVDRDINLMKSLRDGFLPFDPSSVCGSLPETYRGEVPPVSEMYERAGKKWLSKRLEFQRGFPENYPERKRHKTSDGVKVKTISELVVYERFKAAGLFQIYELPLPPADYGPTLYPDFTILSPVDMKSEIIVEFAGRMDRQDYREDFARRVGRYIASGFIPGVNLFFIFGDNDGNIDSTQITKVIEDIYGVQRSNLA